MMRAIVNNVPLEIICDLVGITIDIQSDGGMHLSEAAAEMRQSKPKTFENAGTRDEKKKTAGTTQPQAILNNQRTNRVLY